MTDDNECEGRGVCGNSGREIFFLCVFVRKTRLELWNEVGDPSESKKIIKGVYQRVGEFGETSNWMH